MPSHKLKLTKPKDQVPGENQNQIRISLFNECFNLTIFFSFLIFSSREDKDKEAIKAAILAQYNNVVEGDESEGDEEEDEEEFGKNTNAETVAKAAVEQRERCRIAAAEKKEKDKSDREKQKKDAEDRKKKAQEKAAKGERKR